MEQKVPFQINISLKIIGLVCLFLFFENCDNQASNTASIEKLDYSIDTLLIPKDTILFNDPNVKIVNGLFYLKTITWSGYIIKTIQPGNIKAYLSVLNGKLHGTYKSYFQDESPHEVRHYKNNLAMGIHYGYWEETGNLKFEYNYYNEKREGKQKKWYPSSAPFIFSNYKNDKENGLQQSWRENGKLFNNYEVKNGKIYGLKKAKLCYGLNKEKILLITK